MTGAMVPATVYFFLLIELAAVAYIDLAHKRIANIWPALNLVLFGLFLVFMGETYLLAWGTVYYSVVFFVVGVVLFAIKIMGAGDSKFLFSFFLLVPVAYQESALLCLLYSTVAIGGSLFLVNCWMGRRRIIEAWKSSNIAPIRGILGRKFAFAPVILISWIWFGWANRASIF
mgnify:CR=1 FL=1